MNYDHLNRLEQDNRPETFFDQRPSYPSRPRYLTVARWDADRRWKLYDEIVEREIHAPEAEMREPDYRLIENTLKSAEFGEWWYARCWTRWQRERGEDLRWNEWQELGVTP